MVIVEHVAVPFDGYGRAGHQAAAAAALREAGLDDALAAYEVVDPGVMVLPAGDPARGAQTSLLNEPALLAMTEQVGARVTAAVAGGRFPLVYGADCSTLLGTVSALRAEGPVGVLFVDGHEDTMPLDVSEDGEAANAEIGLLLGLTGRVLHGRLRERLPALDREELAMLGPRDGVWRQRFNVASLRDGGVWLRGWQEVAAAPVELAGSAVEHLKQSARRWWLHVDLDVLDPEEFPAQGLPDVADEPNGVTWDQLTRVLTTAVACGGCLGWSLVIYDPDQDPDRSCAHRIVRLVADVIAALPGTANGDSPAVPA
ncbi:arginase family protein [Nocardia donostiensis]|uniref:Arginase n=1 Tax=Nocardia donostiensis TaxID=1538463 RepID=A0A1W0AYY6_9NOCA|nr:arginase family protein [Nocardia donostiensis]ONM49688.1 arginase [Nocardia donostiensis]OQS15429.1 arginase [Nocardia donostiensis]OQS17617.1 arginase [Nocardia donostiensis]